MEASVGLVLTGGGARGAYQAGVLKRISELKGVQTHGNPFHIITGASAGAINGSAIAIGCDDFASAADFLAGLWLDLKPSDVFRCDIVAQAHNSLTWILDLSFGGLHGGGNAVSLLDATPLSNFLGRHFCCDRIQANIKRGCLHALALSATNYDSGKSYLFIQGKEGHARWNKSRRVTVATRITTEHIRASAAIPIVFQPVKLQIGRETALFGDGCVRLPQPLSPAIRLGADRILAVGVSAENVTRREWSTESRDASLAEVMGVLFKVMFLDSLVSDNEHLSRLNQLLGAGCLDACAGEGLEHMRPVRSLLITPSVELAEVAEEHQKDMPQLIHYFVSSLGRDAASTSDLMSYLLFTSKYTKTLLDIGYADAGKRIDEVEELLYSSHPKSSGRCFSFKAAGVRISVARKSRTWNAKAALAASAGSGARGRRLWHPGGQRTRKHKAAKRAGSTSRRAPQALKGRGENASGRLRSIKAVTAALGAARASLKRRLSQLGTLVLKSFPVKRRVR